MTENEEELRVLDAKERQEVVDLLDKTKLFALEHFLGMTPSPEDALGIQGDDYYAMLCLGLIKSVWQLNRQIPKKITFELVEYAVWILSNPGRFMAMKMATLLEKEGFKVNSTQEKDATVLDLEKDEHDNPRNSR